MVSFEKGFSIRCFSTSWSGGRFYPPLSFEREMSSQYKVGSGLDVVVEAIDTTPYVSSFKQHTWSFLQRRKIDNWGGGQNSYIRVQRLWKQLTLKSKLRFEKKLIVQNTNVWTLPPPQLSIFRHPWLQWCLWYCINVFVQTTKIFLYWLMRLVDWFHWHFCIVVRLRVLTSLSRILKNQPFAPTTF